MMIQTFEAETLRAAMKKVRAQLGQDAMILRTREVLATGPHQSVRYEVTARGSDGASEQSTSTPNADEDMAPQREDIATDTQPHHLKRVEAGLEALRHDVSNLKHQSDGWNHLERRLDAAIGSLHAEVVQLGRHLQSAFRGVTGSDPLTRGLVTAGVEPLIASAIVNRARAKVAPNEGVALATPPNIGDEIQGMLSTSLPVWEQRDGNEAGPSVHAFVGPTGMGKTRTLVKLATIASFSHHRRVALVTIDLNRIGGLETLKAFSGILGIPMRKASNRRELSKVLRDLSQCDLVLIDTAGCGPWDDGQLAKTADTLEAGHIQRHLVLSATTNAEESGLIAQRHGLCGLSSLIVTKVDEAKGPGALLSAVWGTNSPLSHICDGQGIPDSCHAAQSSAWLTQIMQHAA